MWNLIESFLEGLLTIVDEDVLFGRFQAVAADLGYPYWAFGALWGDPEAIQHSPPPAVKLNYPQAWIERYFELGYDKIDPVVMIAPYSQNSVTWDELKHYRPEFFAEAASFGLITGLSIPLRAVAGTYILCVASDQDRTIMADERQRLEILAHGFFAAYLRIRRHPPHEHGLSGNTVEVIRLSMAGLSVEDVAARLQITTHGVYWCIKEAKRRLNCANAAQLYFKAIQLGILVI